MVETIPYTYDSTWKDKLATYGGVAIQSDALGNVTSDGYWSFVWEGGRRLSGMSGGGTSVSFKYDENGQRIKKIVNGVTTEYTVQGKRVVHVKHGTLGEMHIYYDGNSPDMALYNGVMYRYVHSLQGDILGLCDGAGNLVVQYYYDAWGRQIAKYGTLESTLGTLNPLRYRGYVYDEDLGLYYLRSRYYSPWWGRFLSADSILGQVGGLLQHNLFAYCCNSPLMHIDSDGSYYDIIDDGGGSNAIISLAMLGLLSISGTYVQASSKTNSVGIPKTRTRVEEDNKSDDESRIYSVYTLIDPGTGKVEYVGRTKDVKRRAKNHRDNPFRAHLTFMVNASNLTLNEARGLEHALIVLYNTVDTTNKMNNQIRGISPSNPKFEVYMKAGSRYAASSKMLYNMLANEIACWLE